MVRVPRGLPCFLPRSHPSVPDPQRCLDDLFMSHVLPLWGHSYCRHRDSARCSSETQLPTANRPPALLLASISSSGKGRQTAHPSKAGMKCAEGRPGAPSRRGWRGGDTAVRHREQPGGAQALPPFRQLHGRSRPATGHELLSTWGTVHVSGTCPQSSCLLSYQRLCARRRERPVFVWLEDRSPPVTAGRLLLGSSRVHDAPRDCVAEPS